MLAVFVILGVAGCSKDKGTGPEPENNTPPTVTFLYDKLAAIRSTDVTLAVDTDDADGDAVTVQWAVSEYDGERHVDHHRIGRKGQHDDHGSRTGWDTSGERHHNRRGPLDTGQLTLYSRPQHR